ncbi:hypothetical protein EYF80_049036 [Liparis tanakae]|uniref:Uncharacterized protein n=1 Tax=Liparis tanakae TaxID=230148 RepID=A0A4Z2FHV2_9TELE|nr:hypothetical protein EYF80_049036 [Liparis tanakae]
MDGAVEGSRSRAVGSLLLHVAIVSLRPSNYPGKIQGRTEPAERRRASFDEDRILGIGDILFLLFSRPSAHSILSGDDRPTRIQPKAMMSSSQFEPGGQRRTGGSCTAWWRLLFGATNVSEIRIGGLSRCKILLVLTFENVQESVPVVKVQLSSAERLLGQIPASG